ncbi:MAG: hypothetical protein HKN26_09405 [Acidimicrobiales bacterium]|nr:hypothetical protein [Acidimicrobiales bacterium]
MAGNELSARFGITIRAGVAAAKQLGVVGAAIVEFEHAEGHGDRTGGGDRGAEPGHPAATADGPMMGAMHKTGSVHFPTPPAGPPADQTARRFW